MFLKIDAQRSILRRLKPQVESAMLQSQWSDSTLSITFTDETFRPGDSGRHA